MSPYAADATWGIPGPTFLAVYLCAAVTLTGLALLHRRFLFAGSSAPSMHGLGSQQVAYLNGGQRLAVYTALGGLRAAGALSSGPKGTLVQSGPMPAGATPLDVAVYNAAGRRAAVRSLHTDPWVVTATTQVREGLQERGLLPTTAQLRAVRLWSLAMLALLVLGVVRVLSGIANGRPYVLLIILVAAVGLVTGLLRWKTPKRTRTGDSALAAERRQHHHLAPANHPAYATYGASSVAMGVALYGPATLYAMDPTFAASSGIHRVTASGSGGGSTCGGGATAGASGSCGGGGGGCGGGGCGG